MPASLSGERRPPAPPLPPVEFRRLVCHDDYLFDLPEDGSLAFEYIQAPNLYRSVFDFGCGCGRTARRLLVQRPRPGRYVGIDIHRGMVEWCQTNLSPLDPAFQFFHHDVWNLGLAPNNTHQFTAPFPVDSGGFSLVNAHSIFTHLYKEQTEFYLEETARILTGDGIARTTWFLFDRTTFPMLFDFQVSLFINEIDCSNAVIYDWQWLLEVLRRRKLRIIHTCPPTIRGHQWEIFLQKSHGDAPHNFPLDANSRRAMCGSGVNPSDTDPQTVESEIGAPLLGRHRLHFLAEMVAQEFDSRCRENPWWSHSFYFDNGFYVRGDYDMGHGLAAYGFPESLEGLRVLDVGTASGWFAFYFEQQGAEVVALDTGGPVDLDIHGRGAAPAIDCKDRAPDRTDEDGAPVFHSADGRGFWIMKDILGSRVRYQSARVYDISPTLFEGRKFDLVFLGGILGRLRDPIGALMAARSVCKHRIIATAAVAPGEAGPGTAPRQYLRQPAVDGARGWLPDEACFREWFLAAGFIGVDVSKEVTLRCDAPRAKDGRRINSDEILRIGNAFVP
jgi:SAM-dependent methyltransferase